MSGLITWRTLGVTLGPWLLIIVLNGFDAPPAAIAAVVVGSLLFGAWFTPAFTAGVLMVIAALAGGVAIVVAAPLFVLLAARAAARDGRPVHGRRGRRVALAMVLAFFLTLPFVDLAVGESSLGGGADPVPTAVDSGGEGSLLARVLDALLGRSGDAGAGDGVGAPPPPPEPSINWWFVLAIALVVLAVVLTALWWWHRRRDDGRDAAWSLARLERIGAAVGRRRRPNEGPLAYASALSDHTGDERLDATGPLISAAVYESASADDGETDASLEGLESAPPPKPPRSVRERLALDRFDRRHGLAIGAIAALGVAGWLFIDRAGDLREEPLAAEPWPGVADVDSAIWPTVLAAPDAELDRWVACSYNVGRAASAVGLAWPFEELSIAAFDSDLGATDSVRHEMRRGDEVFTTFGGASDPEQPPGGWYQSQSNWHQAVTWLDSVAGAVAVFEPNAAVSTMLTDDEGREFFRYESLPDEIDAYHGERPFGIIGRLVFDTVWVLDVWSPTMGGEVDRVRWMADGDEVAWAEWRRTPVPAEGRLQADCPADPTDPDGDWKGFEPWEPTLEAPLRIAFDDDGNPFDLTWFGDTPLERVGVTSVSLGSRVEIADAYRLIEAIDEPTLWLDDLPPGPATLTSLAVDQWSEALVIDFGDGDGDGDGDDVVAWRSVGGVEGYEGPLALGVGGVPTLGLDFDDVYTDTLETVEVRPGLYVVPGGFYYLDAHVGIDANGEVVQAVLATPDTPWRLLGLGPVVPDFVAEREAELRACLDGSRVVEPTGACS